MIALELFAGAGGAAMGLHRAGLHTVARVEWDKDACSTLRAAADAGFLGAADVIEGDVRAVDWSPYAGSVDLLWASPPCQAWSAAGERLGASDDRNGWPWTWDVADAVRPTWLAAENVTGLLMHRGDCDGSGAPEDCPACYWRRRILPEAERRFASVQWAVLNSSSYGVPQHRRRVYLICGPRPIAWPKPTHGDPAELRQGGLFAAPLLPWRTVREALNLDVALRPGGSGHSAPPMWLRTEMTGGVSTPVESPSGTVPTKGNQYLHASDPGMRNGPATRPELLDRPSPAVLARESHGTTVTPTTGERRASDVQCASDVLFLGAGIRRLTVTECALLMAWPADYPLKGTKTSQYRQVGNGCTPPVVEQLGRAILAETEPYS